MSLLAPSSSHLRSSRGEHEPLPSLPPSPSPSPTEEEDLANGSSAWKGVRDEDRLMVKTDTKGKGKGKAREVVDLNQDDDGADSYGTLSPVRESSEGMSAYPPTTEEEEEAKRIEEVSYNILETLLIILIFVLRCPALVIHWTESATMGTSRTSKTKSCS